MFCGEFRLFSFTIWPCSVLRVFQSLHTIFCYFVFIICRGENMAHERHCTLNTVYCVLWNLDYSTVGSVVAVIMCSQALKTLVFLKWLLSVFLIANPWMHWLNVITIK